MPIVAAATILTIVPAHADPFTVTYEAAGVQNTTASFDYVGVENFDGLTTGTGESFTTSYGTTASSAYQMSGAYSGVHINAADQYGGAGGTGKYAVTFSSAGYTLMLSSTNTTTGQAAPIDYFGFWLSALDAGNQVSFYKGTTLVYSFSPADVDALLGSQSAYLGNPNAPFKGYNKDQPYVFLNFYDTAGSFNKIVFSESPADGGYESDNQTVGYYTDQTGTVVPEPGSVALFGVGVVGLGFMWTRRHSKNASVFHLTDDAFTEAHPTWAVSGALY